jgi:hypothetical protein
MQIGSFPFCVYSAFLLVYIVHAVDVQRIQPIVTSIFCNLELLLNWNQFFQHRNQELRRGHDAQVTVQIWEKFFDRN